MPEMTKEMLETLIEEKNKEIIEKTFGSKFEGDIKSIVKEEIQECMKDWKPDLPDFTDKNPREDPKGGFANEYEFFKAVYDSGNALTNPVPKLKTWMDKTAVFAHEAKEAGSPSQNVGSLEAGAALIPPEFSRTSLTRATERSAILEKAMIIPMQSNMISIPFINDFNESQGLAAGNVRFRWGEEEAQITGNQVKFKMIDLNLRKASAIVFVTGEMMKFSPVSITPFITTAIDRALDLRLSDAFIAGTGVGQPQGILNAPCLVTIPIESEQASGTLVYENTLNMLARFHGSSGEWFANRTVIPQLGVMSVSVGTGGSTVYVANPGGSPNASAPFLQNLHGSPVHYDAAMKSLGTKGDFGYFDWSQYLVGRFAGDTGLSVAESAHLKFDFDQNTFRFIFYTDGRAWWPDTFAPQNGDTQSPFVVVAARP